VIPVMETVGLGKRYGRKQALSDCTLSIPPGRIVGLVGPNGAGKSTLLGMACGLIRPTTGSISRARQPSRLQRGATDQGRVRRPGHPRLLRSVRRRPPSSGGQTEPGWDPELAQRRIEQVGLDLTQKAGRLSGGQRAQLALTIAAASDPS